MGMPVFLSEPIHYFLSLDILQDLQSIPTIESATMLYSNSVLEDTTVHPTPISRRALATRLAALPVALTAAARGLAATNSNNAAVAITDGLSHASEAIHQELLFNASAQRVYGALTNGKSFDAITRLSDGDALLKAAGAKPTSINAEVGGTFTLFGGYITGRNLEMLPDERLVQAWRAGSWKPGAFSIAAFSFVKDGTKTKLLFDHRGFPDGEGASLAQGWHAHYWGPLTTFLARG
jgi:activator of HSP90 ATPase